MESSGIPSGYEIKEEYIPNEVLSNILSFLLFVLSIEFLRINLEIDWLLIITEFNQNFFLFFMENFLFICLVVIGIFLAGRVHEKIHEKTLDLMGYNSNINYGVFGFPPVLRDPITIPSGESIKRNQAIITVLAPLVILDSISLILIYTDLFFWIKIIPITIFVVNSGLSGQDIFDSVRYMLCSEDKLIHFKMEDSGLRQYILKPI